MIESCNVVTLVFRTWGLTFSHPRPKESLVLVIRVSFHDPDSKPVQNKDKYMVGDYYRRLPVRIVRRMSVVGFLTQGEDRDDSEGCVEILRHLFPFRCLMKMRTEVLKRGFFLRGRQILF